MIRKIKEYIVNNFCTKYTIPYFLLMVLWSRGLYNSYHNNRVEVKNFDKIIDSFLKECSKTKKVRIYIILKGAAGDIALYSFVIYRIVSLINIKSISIVGDKKYIDILNIYKTKYNYLEIIGLNRDDILSGENNIRLKLGLCSSDKVLDLRDMIENNQRKFVLDTNEGYNYNYYKSLGSEYYSNDNTKIYNYNNIDSNKIEKCLLYANHGFLVLCNFENKSYKLARKDSIKFKDYLNKIKEISKNYDIKFVINSVYDNEKLYNDESILITRLNFQEIIWLSEYNKIKLFISERNGLNDVFKVFYPGINQIIIYPDYYNPICDKKIYYMLYKETLKNADVKDFWHLPGNNIYENLRGDFFSTIEQQILRLIK